MANETGTVDVGTVRIGCPACEATIPIPVTAELAPDEDGRPMLVCTPDMTDLWAHTWTHGAEGPA